MKLSPYGIRSLWNNFKVKSSALLEYLTNVMNREIGKINVLTIGANLIGSLG